MSGILILSQHNYNTDKIDRAFYTGQFQEAPITILNVDYEVTGVGDTATRLLQRYRVMTRYRKYELTIKLF